jgi:hypothetical protein
MAEGDAILRQDQRAAVVRTTVNQCVPHGRDHCIVDGKAVAECEHARDATHRYWCRSEVVSEQ